MFTKESIEELTIAINNEDITDHYLNSEGTIDVEVYECPFCMSDDFVASRKLDTMHCFNCGFSGDMIEFLMAYKKWTYEETVTFLSNYYEVEVERIDHDKIKANILKETAGS